MSDNLITVLIFSAISIVSYLLGSISFAFIFTWWYTKKDIREQGSGNAGFTNVVRSAGKTPAVFTLVFDMLKAVISVFVGYFLILLLNNITGLNIDTIYGKYVGGFFCFIGHIFPVFYGFRGGKGVLSLFAVMICCNYRVAVVCLAIFLTILFFSKMVSLSSIIAAFMLPFFTAFVFRYPYLAEGSFIIKQNIFEIAVITLFALIVILKHTTNISRIIKGTENKFSLRNK